MSILQSVSACPPLEEASPRRLNLALRMADYCELAKPRIAAMVLLVVSIGYGLGSRGDWNVEGFLCALTGIGLVAVASGALNQLIERRTDARMRRTANRPLPAGRLQPLEVAAIGVISAIAGLVVLAWRVNLVTALLAAATLALYVAAYTPLKRYTALSTAVGAIPGALPPVLGWTASGAPLDAGAFALFAILYLWQFPHFLAIAWLYRVDYAAAGLRMLPGRVPPRGLVGLLACVYAVALIPASLLPGHVAMAGATYRVAALVLGIGYLLASLRFFLKESQETARALVLGSLIYLPVLLLVLMWDHMQLSS